MCISCELHICARLTRDACSVILTRESVVHCTDLDMRRTCRNKPTYLWWGEYNVMPPSDSLCAVFHLQLPMTDLKLLPLVIGFHDKCYRRYNGKLVGRKRF